MTQKTIAKLSIFIALLLFVPSFYFIAVAAGFIPAIFYLYFIIGDLGSLVLWGIHLLIYTVVYYFISHMITVIIFKINNNLKKTIILVMSIAILIIGSFFPIYIIGDHNYSQNVNIVGVYKKAGKLSYVPWK